ncbi:Rz1-like lysis system protein LysC [uncultured Rheinheimera sp.]|uniref:Rz1-like lysis system protein LysC n=1 Tax=uncultured Rheinheimera sp. TaxID=400532 RepID=UPI00338E638B
MLAGCISAPKSTAQTNTELGCPFVTPCLLPPSNPIQNEDLSQDNEQLLQSWFFCAAQVEMIVQCQERQNEQAQPTARPVK